MLSEPIAASSYKIVDYTKHYSPIMQFNKNKTEPIHQWYSFVEGYSKEFIHSIINELGYKPECVMDPFAGSGTTPLELQEIGIKCYSFEVSPFMHLLSTVKMFKHYNIKEFDENLLLVFNELSIKKNEIRNEIALPIAKTMYQQDHLKKWIFNSNVMDGLLDIKYSISFIKNENYRNLFLIAFASILLEVSNVYRNGKCLSYKDKWQSAINFNREDVHSLFLNKLNQTIRPDISIIEKKYCKLDIANDSYCQVGDVRRLMTQIAEESVDLVITSPPYLNSRDYTDIYIVELWMLDLIKDYESLRKLRFDTIRSHVQVPMDNIELLDIAELRNVISKLQSTDEKHWNRHLCGMVKGYFMDMNILFDIMHGKLKKDSKIYFNVANSAYYGVEIKVDEIISSIAEKKGFEVVEIREARKLRPSSQQKNLVKPLRESVIVFKK